MDFQLDEVLPVSLTVVIKIDRALQVLNNFSGWTVVKSAHYSNSTREHYASLKACSRKKDFSSTSMQASLAPTSSSTQMTVEGTWHTGWAFCLSVGRMPYTLWQFWHTADVGSDSTLHPVKHYRRLVQLQILTVAKPAELSLWTLRELFCVDKEQRNELGMCARRIPQYSHTTNDTRVYWLMVKQSSPRWAWISLLTYLARCMVLCLSRG